VCVCERERERERQREKVRANLKANALSATINNEGPNQLNAVRSRSSFQATNSIP
jgi:hypothetical protein